MAGGSDRLRQLAMVNSEAYRVQSSFARDPFLLMNLFFMLAALFLSVVQTADCSQVNEGLNYAVAILPTPVLNTPDFHSVFGGKDGMTLKLNRKKLVEEVEFVALPQTVFTIETAIKQNGHEILKVRTEDYPDPKKAYYIDSRFVEKKGEKPPERKKVLPDRKTIINNLISSKGAIYIWGGNYVKGISQMTDLYKPAGKLSEEIRERWILKGVDCSGLLYEATNGYTPRNVWSFFYYGKPVLIEGLSPDEIVKKLKPLDIIVYKRHMLIVLDSKEVIESSMFGGVRIRDLSQVIRSKSEKMTPANEYGKENNDDRFVIRRWYPE